MIYEFHNILYRTWEEMLDDMTRLWLTSDSSTSREEVLKMLEKTTDKKLADEIIKDWELNEPQDIHSSVSYEKEQLYKKGLDRGIRADQEMV
jgi:hypothetical protein